jgi:AraC-like DNA-binding protein
LDSVAQVLEDAASDLHCPDFGLRLGGHQSPDMLGVLSVAIMNAPDIRTAIRDATRYLFVHSPAYEVVVDDTSSLVPDSATLRFGIDLDEQTPQRQLIDGCLAVTHHFARALIGPNAVKAVSLPHTPLAPQNTYRDQFVAPVHFEQPYAGFHLEKGVLDTDLGVVGAALRHTALNHILKQAPPRVRTQADMVRHVLSCTMGSLRGTREEVSDILGIHPRTLQRRLEEGGTSFDRLREDVYRTTARHYLRETDISIAQVAGAMGYSEHSAFTRACKRWFDATPSAIRTAAKH